MQRKGILLVKGRKFSKGRFKIEFRKFTPAFLVVLLLVGLYVGLYREHKALPSPHIGKPLPEFALNTLHGDFVRNQDFQNGQMQFINFFASWCVPCLAEHPTLMRLAHEDKIAIYGVIWNDTQENAVDWLAKHGSPYQRVMLDPAQNLMLNLGGYGVPETFIIDGNGIIRYRYAGAITPEIFRTEISPQIERWQ